MTDVASFRNVYPAFSERIRMRPPIMPPTLTDTPPPAPPEEKGKKRKSKTASVIVQQPVQVEAPPDKCEMDQFFKQSKDIRDLLVTMNGRLASLDNNYKTFLQTGNDTEQCKIEEDIEKLIQLVNQNSLDIKHMLSLLKADNDRLIPQAEKGSGDARMRTLHYASLVRQFGESMKHFKEVQKFFSDKQRDQIKATYLIVRPYASLAELNKLFDATGGIVLTRTDILKLGDKGDLSRHLQEVRARRDSVLKIESGIKTLNQMFIEMQALVEEQGEILDSIEDSVEHIEDYIEEAQDNMREGRELQKAIRKKHCSII